MITFTIEQKTFIAKEIVREVNKLVREWIVPMKNRERAIMVAVANAVSNLPQR